MAANEELQKFSSLFKSGLVDSAREFKGLIDGAMSSLKSGNLGAAASVVSGDLSNGTSQSIMKPPTFSGGGGGGSPFASGAMAAGGVAASSFTSSLPGMVNTAITQDAYLNRVRFFSGMGNSQVAGMQGRMNAMGLPMSSLDASRAMLTSQMMGVGTGLNNFNNLAMGMSTVSNLMPGVGLTGGAQVTGSMQQARGVNVMRLVGIQARDPFTGQPKSFNEIAEQIYQRLLQATGGKAPSKNDIAVSSLPGNSLNIFLNTAYPGDTLTQGAILAYIYQKASGQGLSKLDIQRTGGMTGYQAAFSGVQAGLSGGASAFGGIVSPLASFANLLKGFFLGPFAGAKAEGGATEASNAYLVGEKGPELFVPKVSGTIIPHHRINSKLKFAGARSGGGDVTPSDFARSLATSLGAPASQENIDALMTWMNAEGGGGFGKGKAAYNPLNTTYKYGMGDLGDPYNDVGVRNYKNWDQGVKATVGTLTGKSSKERGYDAIVAALRDDAGKESVLAAIENSHWIGSQGSKYPSFGNLSDKALQNYANRKSIYNGSTSVVAPSTSSSSGGGGGGESGDSSDPSRTRSWRAGGVNRWAAGTNISYGGVNVAINLPNNGNVTAQDVYNEFKKQMDQQNIYNSMQGS
jgi:hypothetical protein